MGGNAFANVSKINHENVEATLAELFDNLKMFGFIENRDFAIVGSIRKKGPGRTYGDIDIAVTNKELLKHLDKFSTAPSVKIVNGISISFPIVCVDERQYDQFVQVDFFAVIDLCYAKWSFYAPSEFESAFKGIYRNVLIGQILKVLYTSNENEFTQSKLIFDVNNGVFKNNQTKIGKNGNELKNWKTLDKALVSYNPQEIAKLLFGDNAKLEDTYTFERMVELIDDSSFFDEKTKFKIFESTKEVLVNIGISVPSLL